MRGQSTLHCCACDLTLKRSKERWARRDWKGASQGVAGGTKKWFPDVPGQWKNWDEDTKVADRAIMLVEKVKE
jgi:hypothetical protein